MSITDELREWYKDRFFMANGWNEIAAIADRIDAEHQKAIHELNGLAEVSVLLPKDADGEVIRAGDRLDGYGKTITVVEMRHGRSGWVLISEYGNAYADNYAFTHHHAPTVEDVLREFALKVAGEECMTMRTGVVEEYAEKLREVMAE